MSYDELSGRKQKILQILIDKYITSAEPVSSKDIQEGEMQEFSSATIRSELATLEEMGYLIKPHISAGRMPSPKAYRLYVEKLMQSRPLMSNDLDSLKKHFDKKCYDVSEIIRSTAKIISDVTNYTSVIVLNDVENVTVNSIKLVDLGKNIALIIILTDSGMISDKSIELPDNVGANYFTIANDMINKLFSGKTVSEISKINLNFIKEMEEFRELFDNIIEILSDYSKNPKVFLEGTNKMFDYPEYNDINNAKQFLSLIESKERLTEIIDDDNNIEFQLKIGKDVSGIENCAIVTARYMVGGKEIGHAGVIGPERMNYNKVLQVLSYITKTFKSINEQDEE